MSEWRLENLIGSIWPELHWAGEKKNKTTTRAPRGEQKEVNAQSREQRNKRKELLVLQHVTQLWAFKAASCPRFPRDDGSSGNNPGSILESSWNHFSITQESLWNHSIQPRTSNTISVQLWDIPSLNRAFGLLFADWTTVSVGEFLNSGWVGEDWRGAPSRSHFTESFNENKDIKKIYFWKTGTSGDGWPRTKINFLCFSLRLKVLPVQSFGQIWKFVHWGFELL